MSLPFFFFKTISNPTIIASTLSAGAEPHWKEITDLTSLSLDTNILFCYHIEFHLRLGGRPVFMTLSYNRFVVCVFELFTLTCLTLPTLNSHSRWIIVSLDDWWPRHVRSSRLYCRSVSGKTWRRLCRETMAFGSLLVILSRMVNLDVPHYHKTGWTWSISHLTNWGISWVTTKVRIMPKLTGSSTLH